MLTMTLIHVCLLGLLCSASASVIMNTGSINYCDGLECPMNTACSVQSTTEYGETVTTRTCTNMTGHVVRQETTHGPGTAVSSVFMVGNKMCVISRTMVNGEMNVTKKCRDGSGDFRPMTEAEEQEYNRRMAEAEEMGRRAAEDAQRAQERAQLMFQQRMKEMQENLANAREMTAQAQKRGHEIAERTRQHVNEMMANIAERNSRAERERESRMEAMHRQLEAAQHKFEKDQEMREQQLEAAARERERYMEKMFEHIPNFVEDDDNYDSWY